MATPIIEAVTRQAAEQRLDSIEQDLLHQANQIRAVATAMRALLPADPFVHPAFKAATRGVEAVTAEDTARYELRNAVIAVREFANTLEYCGCVLQDSLPDELERFRTELGLRSSPEANRG